MFGKKKEKAIVMEKPILANQEIINTYAFKQETTNSLDHLNKLRSVQGNTAVLMREIAKAKGFSWIVKSSILREFKYHATITDMLCKWQEGRLLQYIGDIPDFAIERIEQLQAIEYSHFTIHSNEKLAVRPLEKIDPVIIAWHSYIVGWGGLDLDRDAEGVVVAMWDMDKELLIKQ